MMHKNRAKIKRSAVLVNLGLNYYYLVLIDLLNEHACKTKDCKLTNLAVTMNLQAAGEGYCKYSLAS